MTFRWTLLIPLTAMLFAMGCGDDDDDEPEADRRGVGAECTTGDDCTEETQSCLTQFKGGYCGIDLCIAHEDCPAASACVTHDDGNNYCFRTCTDKAECNENRSVDNESNCVGSVTWVGDDLGKACVPPSGA